MRRRGLQGLPPKASIYFVDEPILSGGIMKETEKKPGKVIPLRTDPYTRFLSHSEDVKFFFDHIREDTDFVVKLGKVLRGPYAVNLMQQVEELYRKSKRD